nr:MFS transporter [Kribbella sp. VKM Ac-2571]
MLKPVAGFAAFGLFWGAWGAILPAIRAGAGVNDGELGVALLMIGLGALVSMRFTGYLIDRYGGVVLPVVTVLFALCGVLPALAGSVGTLSAALLLLGATSGATDVAINATGSHTEHETGRPVMNLAHGMFSVAVVVASLGTAGLRAAGVGAVPVLAGAATLILITAVAVLAPGATKVTGTPRTRAGKPRARIEPVLLVFGVLCALAYLVENAWQSWSAVHLDTSLNASPGLASTAPAVFAAAAATGRFAGNALLARVRPVPALGRRRCRRCRRLTRRGHREQPLDGTRRDRRRRPRYVGLRADRHRDGGRLGGTRAARGSDLHGDHDRLHRVPDRPGGGRRGLVRVVAARRPRCCRRHRGRRRRPRTGRRPRRQSPSEPPTGLSAAPSTYVERDVKGPTATVTVAEPIEEGGMTEIAKSGAAVISRADGRDDGEEWTENYTELPGGAGVSLILESTTQEGVGPRLHLHPYAETFIIRRGSATFTVDTEEIVGKAGQILVVPAETPHKFRTGPGGYEAVHIHANPTFETTWLE